MAPVHHLLTDSTMLSLRTHTLGYSEIVEIDSMVVVMRPFLYANLYDRLWLRPHLEAAEKLWLVVQMVDACSYLAQQHLVHGDIRLENVLVTSWLWVVLADCAPYKPAVMLEVGCVVRGCTLH